MYGNNGVQRYHEANVNSMTKEKMIVLLYEKIISDLNAAKVAIEAGDRLEMTKKVNHSQRIVSELTAALDHKIGGDISRNLESVYGYLFHEHLELLIDQNPDHVTNCINVIAPLLDAWKQIPSGTGKTAERQMAQSSNAHSSGLNPANSNVAASPGSQSKTDSKSGEALQTTSVLSVSA